MAWGALVGAALTYFGNKHASDNAADATKNGNDASIAEQRREYDLARQDQLPWLQTGQWALGQQQNALNGDWSGFQNSPDYKYALDQGMKLSDRSAAAHGALGSGGHLGDLLQLGQGLATQNYGNYMNRLAGLSSTGQTSASNLGSYGMNMANSIGNAYQNTGQARASSYLQNGNSLAGLFGAGANAFGQWYGNKYGGGV